MSRQARLSTTLKSACVSYCQPWAAATAFAMCEAAPQPFSEA